MPRSEARINANTANAQHSTGPRTPAGLARSSQNARKHGLTARDVILVTGETQEFEELLEGYLSEVQPDGHLQQTLFDELVTAAWNLRRVRRMEVQLHATSTDEAETMKKLDRLARHHTRFERTLHRSLKALKALQTNAVIQSTLSVSVPLLSNAAQISKRTQRHITEPVQAPPPISPTQVLRPDPST